LVFQTVLGGLIGYAASGLILLYAVVNYAALIPFFVPGVIISTVLLAGVGLLRNHILRYIAARGFKTAFHFQTAAFGFYVIAIMSGAIGLGSGYGYVSPQSTSLVLPFAGLFILFIYLNILWTRILKRSEEARLCIFQFLIEHNQNQHGYSWLKRGLSDVENRLHNFGVAIKRHWLYFGCSYSLFEGSYLDWDLDGIYLLGDWTSRPNDPDTLKAVHQISSLWLYSAKKAENRGFSQAYSPLDLTRRMSTQTLQVIIAVLGIMASIIIAILRR